MWPHGTKATSRLASKQMEHSKLRDSSLSLELPGLASSLFSDAGGLIGVGGGGMLAAAAVEEEAAAAGGAIWTAGTVTPRAADEHEAGVTVTANKTKLIHKVFLKNQ